MNIFMINVEEASNMPILLNYSMLQNIQMYKKPLKLKEKYSMISYNSLEKETLNKKSDKKNFLISILM